MLTTLKSGNGNQPDKVKGKKADVIASAARQSLKKYKHMRGVSLTETLIMMPVFLMLTLGALQYALIYEAKSSLDYATFMSARAGAVDHARKNAITLGLSKSLAPLYSPDMDAGSLLTSIAKARLDVGAFSQIRILNPTKEAFTDFGVKNTEKNVTEIPNEMLHLASTTPGKKSKLNIQDANLLKVQVLYGYKLKVPFVNSVISTVSSWFTHDPVKLAYLSQKRLPILATATVRMQSRAWDNTWVTKRADVDNAVKEAGKPAEPLVLASLQRPWASGPTGQGNPSANPGTDTNPGGGQPGNSGGDADNPTDNKPPEDKPTDGSGDNDTEDKPDCENNADNSSGDSDRSEDQGFWGNLWDKVKDATTSVYNFIKGFWQGIKNQVGDIVDTVTQPAETAKGLYELAKAFIDDPQKTIETIAKALGKDLMTLVECGSYDQGRILGEYVSPAFMLKLATKLAKFPNLARALDETKKDFGCASFTAGTPIWIPGGSLSIEDLLKGAYVNSRDENTFENSDHLVTHLHTRKAEGYHHIQTELGDINVTEEHPFWMQGKGWVKAKELKRGDPVATINGDILIYQNQYVDKLVQVYNFTVDKTHNYFAGSIGAWVHNAGPNCDIGAINRSPTVGSVSDGVFAQVKAKPTKAFSPRGQEKYSEIAGTPIRTVQDLTDALKSGLLKPSDVPVDYVTINGQSVIANTRTATALTNAGIPRSQWSGINRTGQKLPGNNPSGRTFDDNVNDQIRRNDGPIDPSDW